MRTLVRYTFEVTTLVVVTGMILHGIMVYLAHQGAPQSGYSDKDRAQLNWLAMKHTRNINGKFQGRVSDGHLH
jgi:hypothetical protein